MKAVTRTTQTVVLYDGLCALCRGSVRVVRRLDWRRTLAYADVQDWAAVQTCYPHITREAALGQIHVVRPDGHLFTGYAGMREIVKHLPLLAWLYPLLHLPGITWLGPRIYRWVARRRYQINRLLGRPVCEDGTCRLPE